MFARVAGLVRRVFACSRPRRARGQRLALEALEQRLAPASVLLPGGLSCTCPLCTGMAHALTAPGPAAGALGASGDAYVLGGYAWPQPGGPGSQVTLTY